MKHEYLTPFSTVALLFLVLLVGDSGVALADRVAHYRVTIDNFTGQPLSPPVAVTHQDSLNMLEVGALASAESEAIADSVKVTQVISVDEPLAPKEATTFRIMAHPGDRLSLATRVRCTSDEFAGLNRVRLPKRGAKIIWVSGYDSGTENHTERGTDIVGPCSAAGPVSLAGKLNGNENAAVDTTLPEQVKEYSDITHVKVVGDQTAGDHARTEPVAKITITRVVDDANEFLARLSDAGEVPPPVLATNAWGQADFKLNDDVTELSYRLKALKMESGAIQAAIHRGLPDDNGPVVAFLYRPASDAVDERLNIRGQLTQSDLVGPLAGNFEGFVDALHAGELYVNIHSNAYPAGEIRGQVGAK